MATKSKPNPNAQFLKMMMSLYFTNKVEAHSGTDEAVTLPPMEALVLGLMCLEAPGVRIVVASPDEVNTYRGRAREIG